MKYPIPIFDCSSTTTVCAVIINVGEKSFSQAEGSIGYLPSSQVAIRMFSLQQIVDKRYWKTYTDGFY